MKYSIRAASDADYQYCYRLTKRNMFDLFCRHWGGWVSAEFRKSFNADAVSMVVMNGRRVGYLSVKRDDQGIYLENIQLSPFLQGRGIGTEILEQLLNRHDREVVRLTTFADNPARRLYERLGFIITEREAGTLRMARSPTRPIQPAQKVARLTSGIMHSYDPKVYSMENSKADVAIYLLTGLLQRLEADHPGMLQEMIEGVEGDRASLPIKIENRAHIESIFDEALAVLNRANQA